MAGGLAVRLVYLLVWRNPWAPVGDPTATTTTAPTCWPTARGTSHPYRFLLYGSRMPGADHPPAFLTVLAGFSWLGLRSSSIQVIGCFLGALGIGAMGLAGRRIAGERVSLIAAALTAVSPNVFFFDPALFSETLVVSSAALVLLAAYRWWDRPSVQPPPSSGRWWAWRARPVGGDPARAVHRPPARVVAAPGGPTGCASWPRPSLAAVVIAPWVGYNMARFEEPTILSAQFDQTLGTAN